MTGIRDALVGLLVLVIWVGWGLAADNVIVRQTGKVFVEDGGDNAQFGEAVAVDGAFLVVGAPGTDSIRPGSGGVFLFEKDTGGLGAWGEVARILPDETIHGDFFGRAVDIQGDLMVVGAPRAEGVVPFSGRVYIYQKTSEAPGDWALLKVIEAADGGSGDHFGESLVLDGDTLAVGAFYGVVDDLAAGAVYIFQRDAGGPDQWGQIAKITSPNPRAYVEFGYEIDMEGDRLVVGAPFESRDADHDGAVYVFERNQGGTDAWGMVADLQASSSGYVFMYGGDVAISGDEIVVGAPMSGTANFEPGTAFLFHKDEGGMNQWGQVVEFSSIFTEHDAEFGARVGFVGDRVTIAAPTDRGATRFSGAVHVFERNQGGPGQWGWVTRFFPAGGRDFEAFSYGAVVPVGNAVFCGSPEDTTAGSDSGSVFLFDVINCEEMTFAEQPQSVTTCVGGEARFEVSTTSNSTPDYQWLRNGAEVLGATGPMLVLDNLAETDAGTYACRVTDLCGSRVSLGADLVVSAAPTLEVQPESRVVCQGAPLFLNVSAKGAGPRTYQWRRDEAAIDGAVGNFYFVDAVDEADAGLYDCVVSNRCGSTVSLAAAVVVRPGLSILKHPASIALCPGDGLTLDVAAVGAGEPRFQWYRNGVAVAGAVDSTLHFDAVTVGDAGMYACWVEDDCQSQVTSSAQVIVDGPLHVSITPGAIPISLDPLPLTALIGCAWPDAMVRWRNLSTGEEVGAEPSVLISPALLEDTVFEVTVTDGSSLEQASATVVVLVPGNAVFRDVNGDGLNSILDLYDVLPEWTTNALDANGDGVLDIRDLLYINLDR